MAFGSQDLRDKASEFAATWQERSRRPEARALAGAIVAQHRDELSEAFEGMDSDRLVAYVEAARADGDSEAVALADVWIVGALPQARITGGN